ncbi:unnamed protein product [Sympodiomycopsis kandeliae]
MFSSRMHQSQITPSSSLSSIPSSPSLLKQSSASTSTSTPQSPPRPRPRPVASSSRSAKPTDVKPFRSRSISGPGSSQGTALVIDSSSSSDEKSSDPKGKGKMKEQDQDQDQTMSSSPSNRKRSRPRSVSSSSLTSIEFSDDERKRESRYQTNSKSKPDFSDDEELEEPLIRSRTKRSTAQTKPYAFAPKMYRSKNPNKPIPKSAAEKANIKISNADEKKFSLDSLLREKKRKIKKGVDFKDFQRTFDISVQEIVQDDPEAKTGVGNDLKRLEQEYWQTVMAQDDDDDNDGGHQGQNQDGLQQTAVQSARLSGGNPFHNIWQDPHAIDDPPSESAANTSRSTPNLAVLEAIKHMAAADDEQKEDNLKVAQILADDAENQSGNVASAERTPAFRLWQPGRVIFDVSDPLKGLCNPSDSESESEEDMPFGQAMYNLVLDKQFLKLSTLLRNLVSQGQVSRYPSTFAQWGLLLSIYGSAELSQEAREVLALALPMLDEDGNTAFSVAYANALLFLGAQRNVLQTIVSTCLDTSSDDKGIVELPEAQPTFGPPRGDAMQDIDEYLHPRDRSRMLEQLVRTAETVFQVYLTSCKRATLLPDLPAQIQILHVIACDDTSFEPLQYSLLQGVIALGVEAIERRPEQHASFRNAVLWFRSIYEEEESYQNQLLALRRFPSASPLSRTLRRNSAFCILFSNAFSQRQDDTRLGLVDGPVLPSLQVVIDALSSRDAGMNPLYVSKENANYPVLEAKIGLLGIALSDWSLQLVDPDKYESVSSGLASDSKTSWGQSITSSFRTSLTSYLPHISSTSIDTLEPSRKRLNQLQRILSICNRIQFEISSSSAAGDQSDKRSIEKASCRGELNKLILIWKYIQNQSIGVRPVPNEQDVLLDQLADNEEESEEGGELNTLAKNKANLLEKRLAQQQSRRSDQRSLDQFFRKQ